MLQNNFPFTFHRFLFAFVAAVTELLISFVLQNCHLMDHINIHTKLKYLFSQAFQACKLLSWEPEYRPHPKNRKQHQSPRIGLIRLNIHNSLQVILVLVLSPKLKLPGALGSVVSILKFGVLKLNLAQDEQLASSSQANTCHL